MELKNANYRNDLGNAKLKNANYGHDIGNVELKNVNSELNSRS